MATTLAFYIWGAHCRHLANTTEPSMCGGDAALCQITLTTCSVYMPHQDSHIDAVQLISSIIKRISFLVYIIKSACVITNFFSFVLCVPQIDVLGN